MVHYACRTGRSCQTIFSLGQCPFNMLKSTKLLNIQYIDSHSIFQNLASN